MKILSLSDIHARFDRVHPDLLPASADLVLIAGDITNLGMRHPSEVERARIWLRAMAARYPQVLWVPGNHDIRVTSETFADIASNCHCLLKRVEMIGDIIFYGEALTVCFDRPHYEKSWDYMTAEVSRDQQVWENAPVADVIVSHSPPYGVRDATRPCRQADGTRSPSNIGSPGLRAYIERHSPRLVICGHVHEGYGAEFCGETLVHNVAEHPLVIEM